MVPTCVWQTTCANSEQAAHQNVSFSTRLQGRSSKTRATIMTTLAEGNFECTAHRRLQCASRSCTGGLGQSSKTHERPAKRIMRDVRTIVALLWDPEGLGKRPVALRRAHPRSCTEGRQARGRTNGRGAHNEAPRPAAPQTRVRAWLNLSCRPLLSNA